MADLHLYLASQSLFNGFDSLKAYQLTHFLNPIFNLNLSYFSKKDFLFYLLLLIYLGSFQKFSNLVICLFKFWNFEYAFELARKEWHLFYGLRMDNINPWFELWTVRNYDKYYLSWKKDFVHYLNRKKMKKYLTLQNYFIFAPNFNFLWNSFFNIHQLNDFHFQFYGFNFCSFILKKLCFFQKYFWLRKILENFKYFDQYFLNLTVKRFKNSWISESEIMIPDSIGYHVI